VVVAVDFHQADLAELTLAHDPVARFHQVRRAAPLRTDLHHAFVLSCGGEHRLAFHHVDGDRLLAIDMCAGLHSGDHIQRVPVVRRAHQDDIEVLLRKHGAVVGERARFLVRGLALGHQVRSFRQHAAVYIAERDHLHRRHLNQPEEVALAIPSTADHADAQRF
jgi:hypothetical protein